jgi:hypothetical protein
MSRVPASGADNTQLGSSRRSVPVSVDSWQSEALQRLPKVCLRDLPDSIGVDSPSETDEPKARWGDVTYAPGHLIDCRHNPR